MAPGGTLLAWLLPVFAWAPLTYPGYFEFHSGFLPIFNLNDLMRHLVDLGWLPTVGQPYDARGRGRAGLPAGGAAAPARLSPVAAVEGTFGISLLAGALGMYDSARRQLGPWPALLASMIYTYWPMLLATIYVRGALAEAISSWACAPWVLSAADAASTGSRHGAIGLALGLAAAVWTRAGVVLWLAVIVCAYILLVPHRLELVGGSGSDDENPARRRLSPTGLALIGWTGGLALGILGLLPVVTQHGFGSTPYVGLADHFVYAFQLLLAGWGTGPSIPGPGDTLTFSLGIVAFGLAVLGIVLFREGARPVTAS